MRDKVGALEAAPAKMLTQGAAAGNRYARAGGSAPESTAAGVKVNGNVMPTPTGTCRRRGPMPCRTSGRRRPMPCGTSGGRGPMPAVAGRRRGPMPAVAGGRRGPNPTMRGLRPMRPVGNKRHRAAVRRHRYGRRKRAQSVHYGDRRGSPSGENKALPESGIQRNRFTRVAGARNSLTSGGGPTLGMIVYC